MSSRNLKYTEEIHELEFIQALTGIVRAYELALEDCPTLINSELSIRNYLCSNYLQDRQFRQKNGLTQFRFVAEPAEIEGDKIVGFIDIKIIRRNHFDEGSDFRIECKRLDVNNKDKRIKQKRPYKKISLAVEYIKNGIMRFVQKDKYPNPSGINGMIGFVVEQHDIDKGVEDINNIIQERFAQSNTIQFLTKKENMIEGFENTYLSAHKDADNEGFELIHLMLDFSSIIT